ncbi:MAG: tRNA (adenosine(37)-N6)-dimethylallyltransferase MiaA [Epsilonproteobacteria bacterium]|nr:tRNA (adenosine(37)-N6)-dimethylallyltransferase MiaA [Campylobacterota bacterium]
MKQVLFIITGPTGVGKTHVALDLGNRMPIEIINADSGQFYEPLTIGTAKPDWRSLAIPHHGFDMLTTPEQYTVVGYRAYVDRLCKQIWAAGKVPVLVGGSLFYIQSLFFPPRAPSDVIPVPDNLQADASWDTLYGIDPVRAQAIHPHDTYRIARALAVWQSTACKPSSLSLSYEPLCDAHIIFLTREKESLYERINDRVLQMFDQGFIDEVAALQNTPWEPFLYQKKFIGYNDILTWLHDTSCMDRQQLIALIQKKTRHYAKRQHTFWRMLCKRLSEAQDVRYSVTTRTVDLTRTDYDLYINDLLHQLSSLYI